MTADARALDELECLAMELLGAVRALRAAAPDGGPRRAASLYARPAGGPCGRTDMTYARPSLDTCARGHRAADLMAGTFAAVPARAFWMLWRAGYHTPDAVRAATNVELSGLRNFGQRSLRAVRAAFPSDSVPRAE